MRLRLIWITWWNNKLLFFFPIVVFYLIVPLLTITTALTQNIEESRKIFIFMQQTLGPISSYFWLIAYLNVWLDEDGEECIRCSQFKKPSAAGEVLLILILFALMTFPIFLGAHLYYQEGFLEYIRLMSTTSFLISCLYFLSVLSCIS